MLLRNIIFTTALMAASIGHADITIPAGLDQEARIGKGYDPDTGNFVGDCLLPNFKEEGQQKANVSFSQTISQSELSKELGIDGSGRFKYGAATIGMSAKFLKSTQESNHSIIAIYNGDYKFKSFLHSLPEKAGSTAGGKKSSELLKALMTDTGLSVYDDDLRWTETCGAEFVAQIDRGAKLFYSIRIDFSSKTEKDLFEANFSYDSSYASVSAHLKNEVNKFSKSAQITVGAMQIGGDVSKITGLFHGEEGNSAALGFVKCSSGQFAECDKVMANAIHYATKEFPEQLKYDVSKNDGQGPAYLSYKTKKYSTVGIYAKFSSALKKDVVNKRRQIDELFDRQLAQLNQADFLLKSPSVLRSPRQEVVLKEAFDTLSSNVQAVIDAAEICYNSIADCADAADYVLAGENAIQPVNKDIFVLNPETFRQFCQVGMLDSAKIDIGPSIKGMIAAAEDLDPVAFQPAVEGQALDKCQVADMVFQRNTVVSFKNRKISNLQPLAEYTHFVNVDLSENKIRDLTPLANWTAIEELNLHDNDIRDLEGITNLQLLTKLRVSNNQLRSIDELVNLPLLIRVDARNNFPTVTCANLHQVLTCLKASVKTDSSFSSLFTDTIIPRFLPSVARISDSEYFIMGSGIVGTVYSADSNSFRPTVALDQTSTGAIVTALQNGNILISGGWGIAASSQLYEFNPLTGDIVRAKTGLQVPRADHQAVLLNDGRVLITGGWEHPLVFTGTDQTHAAEIYDPATQTSMLLPKMHAPRAWHTATLLEDGTVLLVGGFIPDNSLPTAEVFDPTTNTFTRLKKSMSESRGGHTASRLQDGRVLLVGGFNKMDQASSTAEIYDPKTGGFEMIPEPLNTARANHAALVLANGKVLITGGNDRLLTPEKPLVGTEHSGIIKTGELFDPAENSFSQVPSNMFAPRMRHVMIETTPGSVLIIGGNDHYSAKRSEVFTYTDTEYSLLPSF